MKSTLLLNVQLRHINDAEDADATEREGKRCPPFLQRVAENADPDKRKKKKMPSVPTTSSGGG